MNSVIILLFCLFTNLNLRKTISLPSKLKFLIQYPSKLSGNCDYEEILFIFQHNADMNTEYIERCLSYSEYMLPSQTTFLLNVIVMNNNQYLFPRFVFSDFTKASILGACVFRQFYLWFLVHLNVVQKKVIVSV